MIIRNCLRCSREIKTYASKLARGRGKYCSRECAGTTFKPGAEHRLGGEKHPLWKGENASYEAKHAWVRLHAGEPRKCEHCGTTNAKKFEWANISKQYKRELSDWVRLCVSCHRKYDGHAKKAAQVRKIKYGVDHYKIIGHLGGTAKAINRRKRYVSI